jgi:hypothetical protein
MVFNNGVQRPEGNYSTVDVIAPVLDASGSYMMDVNQAFLPQSTSWMYSPTPTFYAMNISGAQRMANGHTLVCSGPQGNFIEVDYNGNTVWTYKSPVGQNGAIGTQGGNVNQNSVFRCMQYPMDYPGFTGHDLTPGSPIELSPLAYDCNMLDANGIQEQLTAIGFNVIAAHPDELSVTPNASANHCSFSLYDISGRLWMTWSGINTGAGQPFTLNLKQALNPGIYLLSMDGASGKRLVVR